MVNFIWFIDKKIFTAVAPSNNQNDRFYAAVGTRKREIAASRLLRTRPTNRQSVMVSVGVSALGRTAIHFVEPGVKVNGQYYRDVLLMQKLLPDIRSLSDFYTFQQDRDHRRTGLERQLNCYTMKPLTLFLLLC